MSYNILCHVIYYIIIIISCLRYKIKYPFFGRYYYCKLIFKSWLQKKIIIIDLITWSESFTSHYYCPWMGRVIVISLIFTHLPQFHNDVLCVKCNAYYGNGWTPIIIIPLFALLWQKEASDIPFKSELLMFSHSTYCSMLFFQAKLYAYILILLKDI